MNAITPISYAISNPGALGSLDAYITAVNRIPMLSPEQEHDLAVRLRDQQDIDAARSLVLSHLRLVVSIARQYLGYGLPHADLIQEGNIGLMKAVKRFDIDRGVRLVSFAVHWIKAEINEYVVRNWRMVKVATTKAQRKLFFNLRSLRPDGKSLDPEAIAGIAHKLNVRPEDVAEMNVRLSGGDYSLEGPTNNDDEGHVAPIQLLSDNGRYEPAQLLQRYHDDGFYAANLSYLLDQLDERARIIVEERWLQEEGKGRTLHELAAQFGVSAERIRQIEVAALKKMRKAFENRPLLSQA